MQYKPVQSKVEQGMFEFRGETLDVFLSTEKLMYRFYFDENRLHLIQKKDGITFKDL
jgi:excinuclease UvrABC helicase subunit UvrB